MANDTTMRTLLRNLPVLSGPFPAFQLTPTASPATPQETFKTWLSDSITANIKEPHAMTVSTVDSSGYPDARVLILKDVDSRGWHFAVKATSPKGRQLATNPSVALTFYWAEMGRQVRIRGKARVLSEEECRADFEARPVESRVSAVASQQSEILRSREELVEKVEGIKREGKEIEGDAGWRVYVVEANFVEFWQGSSDRMHWRLQYVRVDGEVEWKKHLLWP